VSNDRRTLMMLALPFVVFFAAGILLHLWRPVRILPEWWIALLIGVLLGVGALSLALPAIWGTAVSEERLQAAAGLAYLGGALGANSAWPIALLLPALVLVIRWRAILIQTGRRPPE
jgi:hypothetical protein